GEDGIAGVCDRYQILVFALALWNGRDPILKERLFGLGGPEGNHGEDVKEEYFFLDATPTSSYLKALYKYPQAEFPYARLAEENRRRGRHEREFELADTGVFADGRYFDVVVEYAKNTPNDILIRLTIANRAKEAAKIHVLPQIWFRNTWSWGRTGEGYWPKPRIERVRDGAMVAQHASLATYRFEAEAIPGKGFPRFVFTENETNQQRLFGVASASPYVKDAFHELVIRGREDAVNKNGVGTKAAAWAPLEIPGGKEVTLCFRLYAESETPRRCFGTEYDDVFTTRIREADEFYTVNLSTNLEPEERSVARQAYAGLLWSKQFFHYVVGDWLAGDPSHPPPPPGRSQGRNADWPHLHSRDLLSMPDKWEYPWFAAWDLAFHTIPLADIDATFAKEQLVLLLREWYMHPNGQIPAYEFAFGDVNPPVHAWAAWRTYKLTGTRGSRDRVFLGRVFQKLLLNFTWWVNRKDADGMNIFQGGFLGLDNIGVFDRSAPLPTGGH
ncbi:MAG: MGH1-like glycoside hydrolase domain-containing protein, partial [Candidatus Binatia bacterium]